MLSTRRSLDLAGRRLSYLHAGAPESASALLFLHAFPLNAEMWGPQLGALHPAWRALAPDFRGFGGSAPDVSDRPRQDGVGLDDYAADVTALMDHEGVQAAVVCGCSMGGYAAFALLRQAPDRVAGLVLADTRAGPDDDQARASRLAMLDLVEREGPEAVAQQMLPKLLGRTTRIRRPDVAAAVSELMRSATASGVAHAVVRIMRRPDSLGLLRSADLPVLVVVGNEDELTPVAESELMGSAARRATLAVLPGAGHLSSLEAPDAFNRALTAFLTTRF
ncbi:MAG: alpha/beta fold hydrolase [Acidobacteriota bacterium]